MTTITKPVTRKTHGRYTHHGVTMVVDLLPGDVIRVREHGRRLGSAVSIDVRDLYEMLLVRRAFRERMEKAKARKARRGK